MNKRKDPYEECPILETKHFLFRLVEEGDAKDLLKCYSDHKAIRLFNSDNCTSDFSYKTEEEVLGLIQFWIMEYQNRGYVRFSIVDKTRKSAIGTIEIFARKDRKPAFGTIGVFRLDLVSEYEKIEAISEILNMTDLHFPDLFGIDSIITKAIIEAENRIKALETNGYHKLVDQSITSYSDYYIKKW